MGIELLSALQRVLPWLATQSDRLAKLERGQQDISGFNVK